MASYAVTIRTIGDGPADHTGQPTLVVDHHLAGRAAIDIELLSGGHLLHLAIAGCLFNDILREAPVRGISIERLAVSADGGFDERGSTGVRYEIGVESPADRTEVERLVSDMEADATIPAALRSGAPVERAELRITAPS
jgi:OsmC-like protein